MTRVARQELIRSLLLQRSITSQQELVRHLKGRGVGATQATVSRDLRRLGVIKAPTTGGKQRYLLPEQIGAAPSPAAPAPALERAFRGAVTGLDEGTALLLVRTRSGHANAVAAAIDEARLEDIAGTIAGNDTILVVARDRAAARRLRRRFHQLID
jgi:transcriptional regulator of arginine metabolism